MQTVPISYVTSLKYYACIAAQFVYTVNSQNLLFLSVS